MIKVYFSPQVALPGEQIEYSFRGEVVTAKIGDTEDVFDFSSLPDGELDMERESRRPFYRYARLSRRKGWMGSCTWNF